MHMQIKQLWFPWYNKFVYNFDVLSTNREYLLNDNPYYFVLMLNAGLLNIVKTPKMAVKICHKFGTWVWGFQAQYYLSFSLSFLYVYQWRTLLIYKLFIDRRKKTPPPFHPPPHIPTVCRTHLWLVKRILDDLNQNHAARNRRGLFLHAIRSNTPTF